MCCPLDQVPASFIPTEVAIGGGKGKKICTVKGYIDRSPKTYGDRFVRFFQSLEWIEKIAEIADESFHLLGSVFRQYASVPVYNTLQTLHHNAHEIEHLLHAACFFGDLTRLMTGKFFEYTDEKRTQIHYLRSIARVCHAVSHLFATGAFLLEQRWINFGKVEKFGALRSIFSILGYGIMTTSMIWDRWKRGGEGLNKAEVGLKGSFASDLAIHGSGLLFETIPVIKNFGVLTSFSAALGKLGALAGIVHAWLVSQRLGQKDREEVSGYFIWPATKELENQLKEECKHHDGHDHHGHHHNHFKFIAVKQSS